MTEDLRSDPTFLAPPSGPDLVVRQRLLDSLTLGTRGPVTLVIAAPGSGKTQLLANWFASAEYPGPKAWVTLDAQLGRPAAFWTAITTALAGIGVLAGNAIDFQDSRAGEVLRLGASVASQPVPIVLVLDQAECLAFGPLTGDLDRVLTHAAGKLRIVIGSRVSPALPLHRYRLDGTVFEVRPADLAFTGSEAAEMAAAAGVDVLRPGLSALIDVTEGWAAGIRLGLLALRDDQPVDGSQSEVWSLDSGYIADYLRAEVVDAQQPEVRDVLLRTCFIERVWPDLVNTLTGRTDSQRILDSLEKANTFVERHAGNPPFYRFHPLLRAVLQRELDTDPAMDSVRLRRTAARWLARHGHRGEAVRLAMTTGDWSAASSIIVEDLAIARLLIRPSDAVHAPQVLAGPLTNATPQVGVVRAALALDASDFEAAEASLAQARDFTRQKSATPATKLAIAVVDTALATSREAWADVLVRAEEAEKLLAEQPAGCSTARVSELRALILWYKGTALLWLGDLNSAVTCFSSGVIAADRASFAPVSIECLGQLALLQILKGNPHRAGELATAVGRLNEEIGNRVEWCPAADVALAWVKAQQSDLHGARQHADRASKSLSGHPHRLAAAVLAAIRTCLQDGGDQISSADLVRDGSDFLDPTEPLPSWLESHLAEARSHLLEPTVATGDGICQLPRIDRVHRHAEDGSCGTVRRLEVAAIPRRRGPRIDVTRDTPSMSQDHESHGEDRAAPRPAIIEPLTRREVEVLERIAAHYSTEEIADAMFISVNTVRSHVRAVLRKLSARRRQQAVRVARQLQLIA